MIEYLFLLIRYECLDPYAFVTFGNASAKSRIIDETLNPQWDQTLILDRILLPGEPDRVWEILPEIVIELFDFDEIVGLLSV